MTSSTLVPRTRSSHDFAAGAFANFGFKSGTRIIELLVSLSIPKFAQSPRQMLANFGIGTLAGTPSASPTTWQWKALICAAFALIVWGAKLWIISRFASATPLNDEWGIDALNLFVPYLDSTLSAAQLLGTHNEHRVFTGRVIALALFVVNGAWDPILETIVNAALHVAFGLCILLTLGSRLGRGGFVALALVTATLLAVPNASENPVWGLETHFYCVLLFGFIAIALLTRDAASPVACGAGLVAATLSFLSLASGAFVFLACAVVIVAKRLLGAEPGRHAWPVAAALLAGFAAAVWLTPTIAPHTVYRAHSIGQFVWAFEMVAAWPLRAQMVVMTVAMLFVNAPLLILAWRTVREPPSRDSVAWIMLGLGLWNGLQFAALAVGRAVHAIDSTRYLDVCAFNLIVNFACAALLAEGGRRRLLTGAWLFVIAAGWAVQTAQHVPQELAARHALTLVQEKNVRAFLATGAFLPGASGPALTVPYPDAARLVEFLSDPKVRRVLPSIFQDAAPPDRLSGVRDALLRAGRYLAGAGALLLALLVAWPVSRREKRDARMV
jgi:hypothetical protein